MTTIVTRTAKGSPLTHVEVDTNFTNLNTAKLEAGAIALGTAAAPSISFTGDTNTGIFSPGADQLAISTGGTSRLSIDSSGNLAVDTNTLYVDAVNNRVAIGTTAPTGALEVGAVAGAVTSGDLLVTTGSTTASVTVGRTSGTGSDNTTFNVRNRIGTSVFYVNTGGQTVGIGTTSAQSNFVVSNSGAEGIELVVNQPDGANTVRYFNYNRSSATYQTVSHFGAAHRWFIGGNEKAQIDSSGRLLVGTSTARSNLLNSTYTAPLQIEGTTLDTASILLTCNTSDATTAPVIHLTRSSGTTVGSNTIVQSGDVVGYISFSGNDGTQFVQAAQIKAEVDGTPGADDMPGRLVFSTTADGASSPTERMRITSTGQVRLAGAGITFNGDTATANELDDYEEGTWTATITPQTSGTITLSTNTGYYVKIGNQVVITAKFAISAVSTPLGFVRISLPFNNGSLGACSIIMENTTSTGCANFWSIISGNNIEVYVAGGLNPLATSAPQFQAGSTVWLTATYLV
jgi:hypothetical protein